MEQEELQKRLLLALALSFVVFIGFGYLFPPQKPVDAPKSQTQTQTQTEQSVSNTLQTPTTNQSSAQTTPQTQTQTTIAPIVQSELNSIATIKSNNFIITIDTFGRIAQMELLETKYHDESGKNLKILGDTMVKPLEIRFADTAINQEAFKIPYKVIGENLIDISKGVATLTLQQQLTKLTVTKKITFEPNGAYSVEVTTSVLTPYFVTLGYRPVADQSMYMIVRGALIRTADGIITTIDDGDAVGNESFSNATILSSFDRYYASLFYDFEKGMQVSILTVGEGDPLSFVHANGNMTLHGYIGPKAHDVLKSIHQDLTDSIEFGWFTFLSTPFYKVLLWIYGIVGNWGWAIIFFTILVKLILFPLSYKGMMSMQRLKELAPKMKELKEKYGNDPMKMNAQMMEMYKKHGANPLGGCLPMLMQIPIFFALYRVLLNADELQGASWMLWVEDLAVMDPYFILPLLMGASMWFQQKITPTNFTDPLQEKIFKWLPVVMTVFFVSFPAGLVLYWLINNLFTIGQQYIINTMYEKNKAAKIALHK